MDVVLSSSGRTQSKKGCLFCGRATGHLPIPSRKFELFKLSRAHFLRSNQPTKHLVMSTFQREGRFLNFHCSDKCHSPVFKFPLCKHLAVQNTSKEEQCRKGGHLNQNRDVQLAALAVVNGKMRWIKQQERLKIPQKDERKRHNWGTPNNARFQCPQNCFYKLEHFRKGSCAFMSSVTAAGNTCLPRITFIVNEWL